MWGDESAFQAEEGVGARVSQGAALGCRRRPYGAKDNTRVFLSSEGASLTAQGAALGILAKALLRPVGPSQILGAKG